MNKRKITFKKRKPIVYWYQHSRMFDMNVLRNSTGSILTIYDDGRYTVEHPDGTVSMKKLLKEVEENE